MSNEIRDLDLSSIQKKKFRINGDDSKMLELNTSDMAIISRIDEAYPKLEKLQKDAITAFADTDTTENEENGTNAIKEFSDTLTKIDSNMRELVDYIFDSNVSEICADAGSMYDPLGGKFRYEHIIETLVKLYQDEISNEFNAFKNRVNNKASKYTKKKRK